MHDPRGRKAIEEVPLAAEYAPMFWAYTKSPRSMSGSSSARLIVSRASHDEINRLRVVSSIDPESFVPSVV
jgi:hypothetical protein